MVLAPEVNFDHLIIDPFADILGTAWLDTFHYTPADVAIKITRNVGDHIILFKYWITTSSFINFDKNTLHDFMTQQFEWIESIIGLDYFNLINIEVKDIEKDKLFHPCLYVEFMFELPEDKFNIAATLLKIKGYTHNLEKLYPNLQMFYKCTSLTAVTFPSSPMLYRNSLDSGV